MRVLLITVGGSDEPVVTSINSIKPDKIIFMCTGEKFGSRVTVDGDGLVCGDFVNSKRINSRPNIIIQTGMSIENVTIIEVEADNPYDTYSKALEIIQKHQNDEIIVDFTGGTKSMSAGLWGASTEIPDCSFILVKGPRVNLEKVRGNLSCIQRFDKNVILGKRQIETVKSLVGKQSYESALIIVKEITTFDGINSHEGLEQLRYFLTIFAQWDNFEYEAAKETMYMYVQLYTPEPEIIYYKRVLESLVPAKEIFLKFEQKTYSTKQVLNGFKMVYDLLRNAERKAANRHYDDAVSRIYRATEMYAQFALLTNKIQTSDVNLELLQNINPQRFSYYEGKRNEKGQIQIGLKDSYDLLEDMKHPIGKVWCEHKYKVLDAIKLRNDSFLAHGMNPIEEKHYKKFKSAIWKFIEQCDESNKDLVKGKIGLNYYKDLPDGLQGVI